MALKRKALYSGQIEKLNGARLKLDEQIIAIEAASTNLIVLDAMSEGAQTMKQINRQMYVLHTFPSHYIPSECLARPIAELKNHHTFKTFGGYLFGTHYRAD